MSFPSKYHNYSKADKVISQCPNAFSIYQPNKLAGGTNKTSTITERIFIVKLLQIIDFQ